MRSIWLAIRIVFVLVVLVGAVGIGARYYASTSIWGPGPATASTTIVIAKGSRTEAIGRQLQDAGIVAHWWMVEAAVQLLGHRRSSSRRRICLPSRSKPARCAAPDPRRVARWSTA